MSPFMMVLLVMMFCLRSHLRVQQWSSERDLYQSALDVCPLNAKVHYNLAKTSSHYMEAMKHYRQALWLVTYPTQNQSPRKLTLSPMIN